MKEGAASLLEVQDLKVHFPVYGGVLRHKVGTVKAVDGVTFELRRGEVLGLVGESGSGKTTVGRAIANLHRTTTPDVELSGRIRFHSRRGPVDVNGLGRRQMKPFRAEIQMIFQDPYSSLNPRMTVQGIIEGPLRIHTTLTAAERRRHVEELLDRVGLQPAYAGRYPHEFSGGQRQRIGIARALALEPEFIVADEPVSALDVSIQAQVLNLLMDIKDELGLTLVFVSHDLKVIEHFCDRVLVMYLGFVVEELPCEDLHERALHPYTRALLGANPINDPSERRPLTVLEGDVPSPYELPPGCPFAGRCPIVEERCLKEMPPLETRSEGRRVACWAVE